MRYLVDAFDYRITIEGDYETPAELWRNIRKFARRLETAISKGEAQSELEEMLRKVPRKGDQQFNFNSYERMYVDQRRILLLINSGEYTQKALFPLLEEQYREAKRVFEERS